MTELSLRLEVDPQHTVSACLMTPPQARAGYVFAHSAGADMHHASMVSIAEGLAARGIATLRFQFPFMETRTGRPDRPPLAQATVRAAVGRAISERPSLRWFAGGRSFGGRMTSEAQAAQPMSGVTGLIFIGFPLHPAGQPDVKRAAHLDAITVPMLFVQGTRDALAEPALLTATTDRLPTATRVWIEHADHSFNVLKRSGRTPADVSTQMLDTIVGWMDTSG